MTSNQFPEVTNTPGTVVEGARVMGTHDERGKVEAVNDDGSITVRYRYQDPAITYLWMGDGTYAQFPDPHCPRLLFILPETPSPVDPVAASLALLTQVVQSKELAALLELATSVHEANEAADLWHTHDAAAVDQVMKCLRRAHEVAQSALRRH